MKMYVQLMVDCCFSQTNTSSRRIFRELIPARPTLWAALFALITFFWAHRFFDLLYSKLVQLRNLQSTAKLALLSLKSVQSGSVTVKSDSGMKSIWFGNTSRSVARPVPSAACGPSLNPHLPASCPWTNNANVKYAFQGPLLLTAPLHEPNYSQLFIAFPSWKCNRVVSFISVFNYAFRFEMNPVHRKQMYQLCGISNLDLESLSTLTPFAVSCRTRCGQRGNGKLLVPNICDCILWPFTLVCVRPPQLFEKKKLLLSVGRPFSRTRIFKFSPCSRGFVRSESRRISRGVCIRRQSHHDCFSSPPFVWNHPKNLYYDWSCRLCYLLTLFIIHFCFVPMIMSCSQHSFLDVSVHSSPVNTLFRLFFLISSHSSLIPQ